MASKHKLTFAVQGPGGPSAANVTAGWSVSFYVNAADESSDIAIGKGTRMANLLRGMMSNFYSVSYIRIQQVGDLGQPTRNTYVYSIPVPNRPGQIEAGAVSGFPEASDSFDALNIRLQTLAGPHRSFLLRGFPDNITEGGGAYNPSALFNAGFQFFRASLLFNQDNWAMRKQTAGDPWTVQSVDVSTPSKALSPVLTIPAGAAGWAVGDTVRVSPTKQYPGLGGLWTIDYLAPTTLLGVDVTLKPKRGKSVATTPGVFSPVLIRKITYSLVNFADAQVMYGTHKLTGRPINQQHGRRKKSA